MCVLSGQRVIVTRSRAQASRLSQGLEAHGAEAIEIPTLAIEALAAPGLSAALAAAERGDFEWVIFTSTNGVEHALSKAHDAATLFARCRVAAVGGKTAEALAEKGVTVDIVPERAVSEGLLEALIEAGVGRGTRCLLLVAERTRDILAAGLEEVGAIVRRVAVYRTVPALEGRQRLARILEGGAGYVTFASSSAVTHFMAMCNAEQLRGWRVACIGPITAATARELGLEVGVMPETSTIEALVEAIVVDAREGQA